MKIFRRRSKEDRATLRYIKKSSRWGNKIGRQEPRILKDILLYATTVLHQKEKEED